MGETHGQQEPLMKKKVYIYRGLPSVGKSSHISETKPDADICSADDYFMDDEGNYNFNGRQVPIAHQWCFGKFIDAVALGRTCIVVDNTNTQRWEYDNYIKLALHFNYDVEIINCNQIRGQMSNEALAESNLHGVPPEGIAAMRQRWQEDPDEILA